MSPSFPHEIKIREDLPLADYTSIKIGGPAQYLAEIKSQEQLVYLYRHCHRNRIPFLALGGGTNVFFSEKGWTGCVAILRFARCEVGGNCIRAEAGATLDQLHQNCLEASLSGFEFASGIPGTIGGAVYGNAGAYGKCIGDCLLQAKLLLADGRVETVDNSYFKFAYRDSLLKREPALVLEVELELSHGEQQIIREKCEEIRAIRAAKLPPPEARTAGSWFKNLKDEHGNPTAAARLLDAVGARSLSVNDAAVHPKHANIFYNKGKASSKDMLELQSQLQNRVYEAFGIRLEREVMFLEQT